MKRNMKKIVFHICLILLICFTLFGCGLNDRKQEGIQNNLIVSDSVNDEKVTVEDFMKHYQLTEADLEGIDLQANIDYYNVLKNELGNVPKEEVISTLKIEQKEMEEENAEKKEREKSNLSYLVEADEFIGEIPDFDTIKYLTYSMDKLTDVSGLYGLVDFQNNKIYTNYLEPVYTCYEEAESVDDLTMEKELMIIQALKSSDVESWKYENDGIGGITWNFGMEFADGTVISYHGTNSDAIFDGIILEAINK